MKKLEDVKVGDIAICYCGDEWTVVNTANNYKEAKEKFPTYMGDFEQIEGELDESEPIILISNSEYGIVAFHYDYDGAYVEE